MSNTSFKSRGSQLFGSLCLIASAACAGSSESAAQLGTDGPGTTDVSKADGKQVLVPSTTPAGCLEVTSSHDSSTEAARTLWKYDPGTRVLSQLAADEQGQAASESEAGLADGMYWKLDDAGRVIVRGGSGYGGSPFRQNTHRDEHENAVSHRAVYLAVLDLNDDDAGQQYATADYANEYDTGGLLVHMSGNSDAGNGTWEMTFEHDAQGRCQTITNDDGGVERRDYDAAGQLLHRVLTGQHWGGFTVGYDSTLTYTHDEQGRLVSVVQAYVGDVSGEVQRLRVEYRDDGSVVEESIFDTDVGDGYYREEWSAGCGDVLALMKRQPALRCETELGTPGDVWMP